MTDPGVPSMLRRFDLDALSAETATLAAIDPASTILWVNPAWREHASRIGGEALVQRVGVGVRYLGGISGPLRPWYEELFTSCLGGGEAVEHEYECSTPERQRRFRMRILPIPGEGLLLSHHLVADQPHDRPRAPPRAEAYLDSRGQIIQCSNCRRVRKPSSNQWDWIPEWVETVLPEVSHGLCSLCLGFYWGTILE